MFGIGMTELIVILVIALIIFGPKRLPELAKHMGKAMREFKKATEEVKENIGLNELDLSEDLSNADESTTEFLTDKEEKAALDGLVNSEYEKDFPAKGEEASSEFDSSTRNAEENSLSDEKIALDSKESIGAETSDNISQKSIS